MGGDGDTLACRTGGIAQAYHETNSYHIVIKANIAGCKAVEYSGLFDARYCFHRWSIGIGAPPDYRGLGYCGCRSGPSSYSAARHLYPLRAI